MASNGIIAHRFANRDYNKEKGLKGNSTSISGNNYYSYSTVFGQWVDEKVCLCYWGSTSTTSYKHMLRRSDFPKGVVLLPYDDGGSGYYYSYHGCDLLGWRGEFNIDARMRLIDYWVRKIYDALKAIVISREKDLDKRAERAIEEYWEYVEKLCSMYKDTTIPKWLKKKRIDMDGEWKAKKIIVKALYKEEREVRVLVDAAFGQGTYKKYYEYCGRYRKAEDNKKRMIELCHRLGMSSPYRNYWHEHGHYSENPYSTAEIRKLTARQRVDLHFANLMDIEWRKHEDERNKKYEKNRLNAYKWIVGCEPKYDTTWSGHKSYRDDVEKCRNMYTGEEYDLSGDYVYGYYWCGTTAHFKYDEYRKSDNKEAWIREFYAKCKDAQDNRKALVLLKKYGVTADKERSWDDDKYIAYRGEDMTEYERILCERFIAKQDKHFADEEAQRRAREIERQRQEEERRREEEYRAKVKQEQIDACIARGAEGCRDLWRLHLDDIYEAHHEFDKVELTGCPEKYKDFFFGGNVLLRFNLDKTYVESSKNVRVPVAVARLWFKKVKQWHEDEKSFKPIEWNTKGNGTYTVSEYKNDILTAGCHDIAYAEMERMYNQILAETA